MVNQTLDDECNDRIRTSEMMLQGVRAEEFTASVCRRHAYVAKCQRLAQKDLKSSTRQHDDECKDRTRTSEMMLQGV